MITISEEGLSYAKAALAYIPKGIPKVTAKAINKAKQVGEKAAIKKISQEYTIKKKYYMRHLKKGSKATPSRLSAFISAKGRVNALSYFKTTPRSVPRKRAKNPVFIQVKKSSSGNSIPSAFLTKFKSGHKAVAKRAVDASGNVYKVRKHEGKPRPKKRGRGMTKEIPAIVQFYGPSTPQMLGSKTVSAFITEEAQTVLEECLKEEINNVLARAGK